MHWRLGFSGNGVTELSVAQYLTELDASIIIIDCNWNMQAELISQRTSPLVAFLRGNGHIDTPIVLAEGTQGLTGPRPTPPPRL